LQTLYGGAGCKNSWKMTRESGENDDLN
jgi:hypothetical protein